MAFKRNYNFEKAERNRTKAQKKQKKLKRQQEETAKRIAGRDDETPEAGPDSDASGA